MNAGALGWGGGGRCSERSAVPPHGWAGTVEAVLFDLDDTLYLQQSWLAGAWEEVAARAAEQGVDPVAFRSALVAVAAGGSDRGRIIDRALERIGVLDVEVGPLIEAFRAHSPAALDCLPGVAEALAGLRMPLALVTDGDVAIQRAKLRALGLDAAFDAVVMSDELGRRYRKPDPAPFRLALGHLGVPAAKAVFVGDRPDKDVAGAAAAGIRSVRVLTGEYAQLPDRPHADAVVADVVAAIALAGGGV